MCDDGAAVEPEDVDSRRTRGEGGRIGDTRIPESAFDPGLKSELLSSSSSSSSSSRLTASTALQKVARLDVLPPAVLGVGAGVDVASCERRCGRYSETFSSKGRPLGVIRNFGLGVGDRPQSSGVPVGVMEV